MSNAQSLIEEIWDELDRALSKRYKKTNDELIAFIEEKWAMADDEKYKDENNYSNIICGRMMEEYSRVKDDENLLRWIEMDKLCFDEFNEPPHIKNHYYAEALLECGREDLALELLKKAYEENPDISSYMSRPCRAFLAPYININNQTTVELEDSNEDYEEYEDENFTDDVELVGWSDFFKEDCNILYELVGKKIVKKPTPRHKKGLKFLKTNQIEILNSMLNALLLEYPQMQSDYQYSEEEKNDFMPNITSVEEFAELLSPTVIYIQSKYEDDFPYIGYSFHCSWDSEHGLGILMYKDKVIKIGDASIAFEL